LDREQNALVECEAAAGEDARGPGCGCPRPQRAGVGGSVDKFRHTSSVIVAAAGPSDTAALRAKIRRGECRLHCGGAAVRDAQQGERDGRAPLLQGKASSTAGFHALADQLRTLTLAGIDAVGNGRGFSTSGAPIAGKPAKGQRRQVTD